MDRFYSQPITRFAKMNHLIYCAIAYVEGDVEDFCRHFFMATMDRKNRIIFKSAIATVIQRLTGWEIRNINKTLQKMFKRNELVRNGYKEIIFNPLYANRVIVYDQFRLGYDGEDPIFSDAQLNLIGEINRLVREMPKITHTEETEEMSALLKKMEEMEEKFQKKFDQQTKILEFLMARAKGEDVETAKTMLRLVKNDE